MDTSYFEKTIHELNKKLKDIDGIPNSAHNAHKARAYIQMKKNGYDLSKMKKLKMEKTSPFPRLYGNGDNISTLLYCVPLGVFDQHLIPYLDWKSIVSLTLSCVRFAHYVRSAQLVYLRQIVVELDPNGSNLHDVYMKYKEHERKIINGCGVTGGLVRKIFNMERRSYYYLSKIFNKVRVYGTYERYKEQKELKKQLAIEESHMRERFSDHFHMKLEEYGFCAFYQYFNVFHEVKNIAF